MYPYNIENETEEQVNTPSEATPQPIIEQQQINNKEDTRHTKPDDRLLEMLKEAIKTETEDSLGYESLIDRVNSREDKEILRTIKMNSIKAEKLLKQTYTSINGIDYAENEIIHNNASTEQKGKESIGEEFLDCMFDCLKDVEFYRKLFFAFINLEIRDILYEIITDNQSDAVKFLYMESKYRDVQ